MATAPYVDADGRRVGEVALADGVFAVQVNVPLMHEAVRAHLAALRAGTHSTKTRAEVRGGGRKPWRQKGTGRARHGSIREPQWVGGGVAHGPKPREHTLRVNKKARSMALRSALSDRAQAGSVVVVDLPDFEEPKTRRARELIDVWQAKGKVLLVVSREEEVTAVWKSFRNLPDVMMVTTPSTYLVLASDTVVFTRRALEGLQGGSTEAVDSGPGETEPGSEAGGDAE